MIPLYKVCRQREQYGFTLLGQSGSADDEGVCVFESFYVTSDSLMLQSVYMAVDAARPLVSYKKFYRQEDGMPSVHSWVFVRSSESEQLLCLYLTPLCTPFIYLFIYLCEFLNLLLIQRTHAPEL